MRLALMFVTHFFADFLLQSRDMGKNKSSSYKYLGIHIGIIFVAFLPFGLKFAAANALIHAVIDKNIWTLYKIYASKRIIKLNETSSITKVYDYAGNSGFDAVPIWKYWEDHWFYATIGFDQLLHALTLVLLAGIL